MGGVTLDNDGAFESSLGDIFRYFPCIAGVSAKENWLGVGQLVFFFFLKKKGILILDDRADIVREIGRAHV